MIFQTLGRKLDRQFKVHPIRSAALAGASICALGWYAGATITYANYGRETIENMNRTSASVPNPDREKPNYPKGDWANGHPTKKYLDSIGLGSVNPDDFEIPQQILCSGEGEILYIPLEDELKDIKVRRINMPEGVTCESMVIDGAAFSRPVSLG